MSVTIRDVAAAAGVSTATVSKVINHSPTISQETVERVQEVIRQMGYRPNKRAQSFARRATKNILFLSELEHGVGFENPHLFEMLAGAEAALARKDYGLLIKRINSRELVNSFTDSNLNHTGIYLYSKGKIMIHLTFDYKTDEKCTTPGQYLKYHRTFQGLSTRELAEKVGIVPATLVLYENNRHPIKYSTAVALANVLGIDRNRLLDKYTAFVDYPYSSLLKKVRQELSLTQMQMAEVIGIGQTSYSGWEREIRVPRRKEYEKILAALKKLKVNVDTYLCQSTSI